MVLFELTANAVGGELNGLKAQLADAGRVAGDHGDAVTVPTMRGRGRRRPRSFNRAAVAEPQDLPGHKYVKDGHHHATDTLTFRTVRDGATAAGRELGNLRIAV